MSISKIGGIAFVWGIPHLRQSEPSADCFEDLHSFSFASSASFARNPGLYFFYITTVGWAEPVFTERRYGKMSHRRGGTPIDMGIPLRHHCMHEDDAQH